MNQSRRETMILALAMCAAVRVTWAAEDPAEAGPGRAFYVDPDCKGTGDGSAAQPWNSVHRPAMWRAIDAALAKGPVTVYFSAREASADTNENTTTVLRILRTDLSTHRLTLDGMSKYNENDKEPVWKRHTGKGRFQVTAGYPITTARTMKCNYVTVRGFKALATRGKPMLYWGGDHVVVEYCEFTADKPTDGPGFLFGYASEKNKRWPGSCTDITIRHNVVHHVLGEGIYIGGVAGQNRPAHSKITIENNTIYDVGFCGGEGDAIDVKDGNRMVVIRGNTLYMSKPNMGRDGIVVVGAALIERNFIFNFGRSGIALTDSWSGFPNRKGSVIRNNIVVNCGGSPKYSWGFGIVISSGKRDPFTNTEIYNNTIVKAEQIGIRLLGNAVNTVIRNNLVTGSGRKGFYARMKLAAQDHNLFGEVPGFVNPHPPYKAGNFRLREGSPAIDKGGAIVSFKGKTDYFGTVRPKGREWDIGAFEYTKLTRAFYIDPDYNGAGDGSAARPWNSVRRPSVWRAINAALMEGPVTVYFSARTASTDTPETISEFVECRRWDKGTHRLTLDGMRKWNTNDTRPAWEEYRGKHYCKISGKLPSNALGWGRKSKYPKQNYITVRGFECAGRGARVAFAGDHVVFEHLYIHDVIGEGPGIHILYTYPDRRNARIADRLLDECTGMTVRHVRIENVYGEGLYVGSVNPDVPIDVQKSMGNEHSNITIEHVTIKNPGFGGGQGDGIDCKNGIVNLTIRDSAANGGPGGRFTARHPGEIYSGALAASPYATALWPRPAWASRFTKTGRGGTSRT